jgi:hypothetical protein
MAKKAAKGKTSTINRTTAAPVDLSPYCPDMNDWPRSWMGWEKDLPPGEKLVACFRPFLEWLAATDLSRKTIRRHVDNLWALGGEIIRDINETPSMRKLPAQRLLLKTVSEDGGPLLHHGDSQEQQRSFDSTCRKLHRFLTLPQP